MTCLQALLRGRLLTVEQLNQLLTDLLPKVSSVLVLPQATLLPLSSMAVLQVHFSTEQREVLPLP